MSVAEFPSAVSPRSGGSAAPSPFERTPPQDIAAEQCVLGGMMLSKDAIADVVEALRSADFYRPAHQLVYDVITDLYGRGEPVDAVTVAAELTKRGEITRAGGAPYLHTLISSVPTAANAGYYARIVRERAILRRLVEAGTRITQMGYAADGDVDDIVDAAQAEVYAVTDKRTSEDYLPLSEIMEGALDEIEAIGSRGGALVGVPTGFADLDQLTNGFHPGQMIIVAARPAIGKALALDTPLPTPSGWTTMGEVRVGDRLLGADGCPTRVVAATDVMTERPCYRVEFSDGSAIVADADHQWLTQLRVSPGPARAVVDRCAGSRHERSVTALWTTEEIAATLRCPATERRLSHSVRNAAPLDLPERDLPLPPYALGVWLARGDATSARLSSIEPEVVMYVEAEGLHVVPRAPGVYTMRLHGAVQAGLPALDVLGRKHIPADYLRGSHRQRRALLAGLLDAGGTVTPAGSVQFVTSNARLAADVGELAVTLGYHASIRARRVDGRPSASSYTVTFAPHDDVFRVQAKRQAHKERLARRVWCEESRLVTGVHRVRSVPVRCIQVDNDSSLYLAGRAMIPTHNSTLALDFTRSAAIRHNLTSVIFSLEMGRNEITMRLLSAEARVALHTMRSGTMTDDDWTRLARRMGEVSSAPLFIDDSPNMTMMEIRAKCRRLKQRHDLRLVVVDYLQLMSSGKRVENRQQEVSEFSRSLKLLAKELDVPVIAISQLNRGPEQRTDKRPLLSDLRESGCMPASTRLLRSDGREVTLGELVLSQEQPTVLSVNDRWRLEPSRLVKAFPSGIKSVFRVRLASGREVDATGNHKFLTVDGWRRLEDIDRGTCLAVPRRLGKPDAVSDGEWPKAHLVLLAHLLGDGSIGPAGVKYTTADPANKAAVEQAAIDAFGITPEGKVHGRTWMLWLPSPYRLTHERRHPVRNWLEPYGLWGARSHTKFMPESLFSLSDDALALFLHHLWATDGSITLSRNGRGAVVRIYYATTSRRLAENVQRALLRFEIRSRIGTGRKRGYGTGFNVLICGSENQARFLRQIGCHGQRGEVVPAALAALAKQTPNPIDLIPWAIRERITAAMEQAGVTHRRLAEMLGERHSGSYLLGRPAAHRRFSRSRLERIAAAVGSADLMDLATSDIYWDEVKEITPLGAMPTFDATVEGTHNFIANGVVTHNSLEQDSDMVILLHREDAYERESPRAGEADLIVAKHRNGPTATITVAFQGHYSRFVDMAHG